MLFRHDTYGPEVARILAADGAGNRAMELFPRSRASEQQRLSLLRADPAVLFPGARDPDSALSGLFLYYSCLTEAHDLLHKNLRSPDGGYWHAIMHRMEGDAFNAAYWFRAIRWHSLYPALQREAAALGYRTDHTNAAWDPYAFVDFCEGAPGTKNEALARRVQLIEWQLLFDHCAAPVHADVRTNAEVTAH